MMSQTGYGGLAVNITFQTIWLTFFLSMRQTWSVCILLGLFLGIDAILAMGFRNSHRYYEEMLAAMERLHNGQP